MLSSLGVQQHANVPDAISKPTLPPSLVSWVEDFSWVKDSATWKGLPDDNFVQFYKAYGAINPDRAQVPPEYLEEFKQRRAADCPEIWQIEEARACAPQSRAQAASEAPTPTLTEAPEPPPLEASPPPPPPSDSTASEAPFSVDCARRTQNPDVSPDRTYLPLKHQPERHPYPFRCDDAAATAQGVAAVAAAAGAGGERGGEDRLWLDAACRGAGFRARGEARHPRKRHLGI